MFFFSAIFLPAVTAYSGYLYGSASPAFLSY
jgi:hypothetical protein